MFAIIFNWFEIQKFSILIFVQTFFLTPIICQPAESLQQVFEIVDSQFKRPNGLYRGTITLLRRNEPTIVQEFELIVRSPQGYISIRSARRDEEKRILWLGQGLEVWLYDVPRRQLIRPEANQRFEPISAMGFSTVDFFYPWFAENLIPVNWRTDQLIPNLRIIDANIPNTEIRFGIGVDSDNRIKRLEIIDSRGILLRVIEFPKSKPIVEWKTNRQFQPSYPTIYEMMDLRSGVVARFETISYDPLFRPDASLFDPDFLSR
ncbi:MAG: hypothetical protein H3C43_05945 [Leptonema sp. (in: Bacteria)]|nr:hypothetical protein [Leptonema sp. (in: bacteria)]